MKVFYLILLLSFLFSCHPNYKEARLVKIGMSTNDLQTIMGEPFSIELGPSDEEWYFTYYGPQKNKEGMCVRISNNKIINFYSY
jgi:hypothetical protein